MSLAIVIVFLLLYSQQTLLSDDMRRELMRKKWEQEVQDALDKPVGPVHYQDVLVDGKSEF